MACLLACRPSRCLFASLLIATSEAAGVLKVSSRPVTQMSPCNLRLTASEMTALAFPTCRTRSMFALWVHSRSRFLLMQHESQVCLTRPPNIYPYLKEVLSAITAKVALPLSWLIQNQR